MARKNVTRVFDAWVARRAAKGDSHGAIWTDGRTIYSYAMPIAVHMGGEQGGLMDPTDSPTVTTGIHRNTVAYLLAGTKLITVIMTARKVKEISQHV